MRRRLAWLGLGLLGLNGAAWAVALFLFHEQPPLIGAALVAYVLGLRHAVDNDHIAVIDNAARVAVESKRHALGGGLWFALGHSTIVALFCLGVTGAAVTYRAEMASAQKVGATFGPLVSSVVLLAVAVLNGSMLVNVVRQHRAASSRSTPPFITARGFVASVIRPWRRYLMHGWAMYPLGLLMGLSFDTASEIGLLALAATQATAGLPLASLLIFPALFAAAMTLVDASENVLMIGAYCWAADDPSRRFRCNAVLTALSVTVAITVATWQLREWLRTTDFISISGSVRFI